MSYLTVPYTCPYIDDMQEQVNDARQLVEEEIRNLEGNGWGSGRLTRVVVCLKEAYSYGEDLRSMNATLREEGESAADEAIKFEEQVEQWLDIANRGSERILELEAKLAVFDAEKEEEWLGYLPAPRNLKTG